MEFTHLNPNSQVQIQAYGDGGFRISGRRIEGAVIVIGDKVFEIELREVEAICSDHLTTVLDATDGIDVLLIGCGDQGGPLKPSLRGLLSDAKLPTETMDTGAACRTFNVLRAEGRRVAALLIPVP